MGSFIGDFAHQQLDGMQELRRDFGRRQPADASTAPRSRRLRAWVARRRTAFAGLARVSRLHHGTGESRRVADH